MNKTRIFRRALGLAAAVAAGVMTLPSMAQWWSADFQYRRSLVVPDSAVTSLPGEDIGVFTMSTGGLTHKNGADIRVVTGEGKERPMRILQYGPGDQVRVAFSLAPKVTRYWVYFGFNKDKELKPPTSAPLVIQRGVLLETWDYTSGGIHSLEEVENIFKNVKTLQGADFQPNIFLGVNPFGPENKLARRFTGWIFLRQDGDYAFTSVSTDASFILIDDKLVVESGGGKGAAGHVAKKDEESKGVRLKAGLHKLTYYHVNLHDDPTSAAAWRLPGAAKTDWKIIGPEAFSPIGRCRVGSLEQYGQALTIDFNWSIAGEAFTAGRYYQRMAFKASFHGNSKPECTWNFGDGQTAKGESVEHVYLKPGEYTVTVTARGGAANELKRTNRVFVHRAWERVADDDDKLDLPAKHLNTVAKYDYVKLPSSHSAEVVRLMNEAGRLDEIVRAGEAMVASGKASADDLDLAMPLVNKVLLDQKKFAESAALLIKAAELTKNNATLATLKTMAGQSLLALRDEKSLAQAMELFDEVVKRYSASTTVSGIRESCIGRGDIWRLRGDGPKARRAYREAGIWQEHAQVNPDLLRGNFARHIEDYIREGTKLRDGARGVPKNAAASQKFFADARDNLDQWAYVFPGDKLDGYWSLLKVRLDMATEQYAEALLECQTLLGASPTSNYGAQLLMIECQIYEKLKQPDKAKAALQRIVDEFKESPLAAEAAKKLGAAK
ncbi:MAG: PKD domain-containing protein [Phycisphaerae bacterium]|nr:PKD domain-containing protein [Phycisphaerae bacterium]